MRHAKAGVRYHVSFSKRWVIGQISEYGAKAVLDGWEGTDAEAIREAQSLKSEFVPLALCDNQLANGECGGHGITTCLDGDPAACPDCGSLLLVPKIQQKE